MEDIQKLLSFCMLHLKSQAKIMSNYEISGDSFSFLIPLLEINLDTCHCM